MSPGGGRGEEDVGVAGATGGEGTVAVIAPRGATAVAEPVAPPPTVSQPAAAPRPPAVAEPAPTGDLWARVLRGPGMTPVLRTILSNLRVLSVDAASGRVVIAGEAKYAESARSRQGLIVDALRRELGRAVELHVEADEPPAEAGEPELPAAPDVPANRAEGEALQAPPPAPAGPPQALSEHPLIREAMELFGARIVDVKHRRPAAPL